QRQLANCHRRIRRIRCLLSRTIKVILEDLPGIRRTSARSPPSENQTPPRHAVFRILKPPPLRLRPVLHRCQHSLSLVRAVIPSIRFLIQEPEPHAPPVTLHSALGGLQCVLVSPRAQLRSRLEIPPTLR